MFFLQTTTQTMPFYISIVLILHIELVLLGSNSAITIDVAPFVACVTFNCLLICLHWSVTYYTGPFDIPSRRGVEISSRKDSACYAINGILKFYLGGLGHLRQKHQYLDKNIENTRWISYTRLFCFGVYQQKIVVSHTN